MHWGWAGGAPDPSGHPCMLLGCGSKSRILVFCRGGERCPSMLLGGQLYPSMHGQVSS